MCFLVQETILGLATGTIPKLNGVWDGNVLVSSTLDTWKLILTGSFGWNGLWVGKVLPWPVPTRRAGGTKVGAAGVP